MAGRHRLADITVKEYCKSKEMPEDETRDLLNKWDKDKWDRIKASVVTI